MQYILRRVGKAFTRHNIQYGFSKCGVFPFNPAVLFTSPLQKSYDDEHEVADVESMIQMALKSRISRCIGIDYDDVEVCGGYLIFSEYDFEVVYRPVPRNSNGRYLSRPVGSDA